MDPRHQPAGMTDLEDCHSRHVLSGIHLRLFRMDPRHQPAGMTDLEDCHSRHLLSGIHRCLSPDGSPPTTRGDDRGRWSCPTWVLRPSPPHPRHARLIFCHFAPSFVIPACLWRESICSSVRMAPRHRPRGGRRGCGEDGRETIHCSDLRSLCAKQFDQNGFFNV